MIKKSSFIVIAIFIFCLSIILQVPAKFVVDTFISNDYLKQQGVVIANIEGTLWNGRAGNIIWHQQPVGAVNWHLRVHNVVVGELSADIELENSEGYINTNIAIDTSGDITLRDTTGKVAANYIAMRATRFPLTAGGDLLVDLPMIHLIDNKPVKMEGRMIWSKASISMIEFVRLGQINAVFTTTENQQINAQLSDGGEVLELNSKLILNPDGNYQLNGNVKARSHTDKALINALKMAGGRGNNGTTVLNYQGKL